MNEIRDILVGIDFGREKSQICYYDRKAEDVRSISMKVGSSQYEFPTWLCRRSEQDSWSFGLEAEYFAKEHDGYLVDNLYEICQKTESIQVEELELQPWELMGIFLGELLKTLGTVDPIKHTKCLTITVEDLDGVMVKNLQQACGYLGLSSQQYLIQDYSESFYYYTFCQKPEYWKRYVGWFAFQPDGAVFRRLEAVSNTKPMLMRLSEGKGQDLSQDDPERDQQFLDFAGEVLGTDPYSSVFITGEGFSQEWALKSVPLLCRQQRKVFSGNNLFAKGACFTAKERLEDRRLKNYLYAGDALVTQNIGMEMLIRGSKAYYSLIEAGNNWYECKAECELILDKTEELVFQISSMENGAKTRMSMLLPGLPIRPDKTTRLHLTLEFISPKDCKITVRDLGFGDLFPSSQKVWIENLNW